MFQIIGLLFINLVIIEANQAPRLSPLIDKQILNAQSKLKIPCMIRFGTQPIQFEWLHNESRFENSDDRNHRIEKFDDDSLLIIEKLSIKDSGIYVCIARNRFGSNRQQTEVLVTGLIIDFSYSVLNLSILNQCVAHHFFEYHIQFKL